MIRRLQFRIPTQEYSGIAKLLKLSDEQYREFVDVIKTTPAALQQREFSARIADRLTRSNAGDAEEIIRVLLTLYVLRADLKLSIRDFVDTFREAVEAAATKDLTPLHDDWAAFAHRLTALLALDESLGITSKAGYLAGQHAHIVHRGEVFTDLRPVFRAQTEDRPVAFIIDHKLKITYDEGGEIKEFYASLSPPSLTEFREVFERAEQKSASLRILFADAGIPVLGEDE